MDEQTLYQGENPVNGKCRMIEISVAELEKLTCKFAPQSMERDRAVSLLRAFMSSAQAAIRGQHG